MSVRFEHLDRFSAIIEDEAARSEGDGRFVRKHLIDEWLDSVKGVAKGFGPGCGLLVRARSGRGRVTVAYAHDCASQMFDYIGSTLQYEPFEEPEEPAADPDDAVSAQVDEEVVDLELPSDFVMAIRLMMACVMEIADAMLALHEPLLKRYGIDILPDGRIDVKTLHELAEALKNEPEKKKRKKKSKKKAAPKKRKKNGKKSEKKKSKK